MSRHGGPMQRNGGRSRGGWYVTSPSPQSPAIYALIRLRLWELRERWHSNGRPDLALPARRGTCVC